jgi:hypothetical protein
MHHYAKRVIAPFELRVKWRHFQIHGMRPVTGGLGEKNKISNFADEIVTNKRVNKIYFSIISHHHHHRKENKKYFPSRTSVATHRRRREKEKEKFGNVDRENVIQLVTQVESSDPKVR